MNAIQNYVWGLSKKQQPQNEPYIEPIPFSYRPFHIHMHSSSESEEFYLRGYAPSNFNPNHINTAQFIEVFIDNPFNIEIFEQYGYASVGGTEDFWVMVECGPITYGFRIDEPLVGRAVLKLPEQSIISNIFGAIGVFQTSVGQDPFHSSRIGVRFSGNLLQGVYFLTTVP